MSDFKYRVCTALAADCSQGRFFDTHVKAKFIDAGSEESAGRKALKFNPKADTVLWIHAIH